MEQPVGGVVGIEALLARMHRLLAPLEAAGDPRRYFLAAYLRTTQAVREELAVGGFQDGEWVERWDIAFADLYLDALEAYGHGAPVPRPWAVAFRARGLPPLRHMLLDINAHINFDLPQSLLAVISSADFDDPVLMRWRHLDHEQIDEVLAQRVGAEDDELARLGGSTLTDRLLRPLNRLGTRRFLKESRGKVWANAVLLDRARRRSTFALAGALADLEEASAARVAQLTAPGPVILRLAVRGFGVQLGPGDQRWP